MKPFLSKVFAAASVGVFVSAYPALSQETKALDNLYACVGYYKIYTMLPADKSVRQYGDKRLSELFKIIMKIEGKSFASPNDISQVGLTDLCCVRLASSSFDVRHEPVRCGRLAPAVGAIKGGWTKKPLSVQQFTL